MNNYFMPISIQKQTNTYGDVKASWLPSPLPPASMGKILSLEKQNMTKTRGGGDVNKHGF